MVKSQWGIKRNCSNCGTKFYDLLKFPVVCPNCNTEFDINKSYKNNYKQKDKKNIISDSVVQEDNLDSEIIEEKDKDLSIIIDENIEDDQIIHDENDLIDDSTVEDEEVNQSISSDDLDEAILKEDGKNTLNIEIESDEDNNKKI